MLYHPSKAPAITILRAVNACRLQRYDPKACIKEEEAKRKPKKKEKLKLKK